MVLAELGSKVAIALRKMTSATVVGTRRILQHTRISATTHASALSWL
jgi:hypothetical protein